MTAQTQQSGEDLEQRIATRTEELLRINALLGEEIARHESTERALRESGERLTAMIAAAPEAVVVIDAAGRVDEWNPQAERTFGWSRDEARGQLLSQLIMPVRYREGHDRGLARYLATREPHILNRTIELAAMNRLGTEFPIELSVWPIPSGDTLRFGAFIRDISLRKAGERFTHERNERALRFRDALYELAKLDKTDFDTALAAILETAAQMLGVERVSYWSLSGDPLTSERAKVYVKSANTYEGSAPGALVDAVRHPHWFAALATHRPVIADRARENPATSEFADTHLKLYGITSTLDIGIWFHGRMAGVLRLAHIGEPRQWQDDEVEFGSSIAAMISLALEASQRHAVTAALSASEEKYRLVVENANEAIVVAQDGFIRFANPVAVSMSGYTLDEYYAMPFIDLVHPEDRERVIGNYRKRMTGEAGEHNYVFRILTKQGDTRWLQINAVPIAWGGRPATLNFLADFTERERLQQDLQRTLGELQRALEQERELSELKSRFVAMTSHEFRTPLATILSATELLEKYGERLPASEKDEMTGLIKAAVVRMTTMLEDVLLIGKADAGRVDFHPLPVDIGRLAAVVVEEVGRATLHRCPIALNIDGDCIARMLDEKLVRHILSNLLSNAAKYSPAGSAVQLSVRCDEGATQFEVADHGIGIPVEDQPRLYSTFHRGGNVSNVSGTGLGLAIVKKCVDVHGGRIGFESAPGRGTTFTVSLPQAKAAGGAANG